MEATQEKIEFQYIMNYRAYRRSLLTVGITVTLLVTAALAMLCFWSVAMGAVIAATALIVGALVILSSYGSEQTYTVYNDRIVFKSRGHEKRKKAELKDLTAFKSVTSPLERPLKTCTLVLYFKTSRGKKTYRMYHVFNVTPLTDFLSQVIQNKGKPADD